MAFESAFDLLERDYSGNNLKRLMKELEDIKTSIKIDMDAGVYQGEIAKARQALAAVESAQEVIQMVHTQKNP